MTTGKHNIIDGADAVLVGASGRIGRLLRRAQTVEPQPQGRFIAQFRKGAGQGDLDWPDLGDPTPLVDLARQKPIGTMILLAGVSSGDKTDPVAMAAHVDLVRAGLSAARSAGIGRVLVASSSAVYGGGAGKPFREGDTPAPVNAYGQSKVDVEQLCAGPEALGLEVCCMRIGNVIGADALIGAAEARGPEAGPVTLDIFPDGSGPRRSYIGPLSLLRVLHALCNVPILPPVLNVAAPKPVSMDALLDAAGIAWVARPREASPLQNIVLDCSQLSGIHTFQESDATPEGLVAEWNAVRGQRP